MCYTRVWKKWKRKAEGYKVFEVICDGSIRSLFHGCGRDYKLHWWYDAKSKDTFNTFAGFGAFKTLSGARKYRKWLAGSNTLYVIHKVKLAHNIRSASVAINGVPRCILGNEMMILERIHG